MAAFEFYLQSRKQRKVGWVGTTVMLDLVKNSLVKEEVWEMAKSLYIFMQSLYNITVLCTIDCLACRDKFFLSNPLDVKKKWRACSWLCPSPVLPFSVLVNLDVPFKHPCTAHAFFPKCSSSHCQCLCHTFSEISQNLMHTCCRIHRDITSGQMHDSK
jgi:hypothetical protein